jgi:hypothetical protein
LKAFIYEVGNAFEAVLAGTDGMAMMMMMMTMVMMMMMMMMIITSRAGIYTVLPLL